MSSPHEGSVNIFVEAGQSTFGNLSNFIIREGRRVLGALSILDDIIFRCVTIMSISERTVKVD